MLDNATLLVTGGTGSFGNDFINLVLQKHRPQRIVILSRDEKKQYEMRLSYNDPRLDFVIGDVRDRNKVFSAMRGVDYVFHAAALKQVPSCEFFPLEAVQTNIQGTQNVLDAAEDRGVQKVVVLSTDKAVYPVNAMGMTKALMEKLVLAQAAAQRTETIMCGVRYGNVLYSRGSVLPLFVDKIKRGIPLTVTDPNMTRLVLPLAQAVELVVFALQHGQSGDFFVRKAPAASVGDTAQALLNLFGAQNPIEVIGVREGEKIHEMLVSPAELMRADETEDYYRVRGPHSKNYDDYFSQGIESALFAKEGYTSDNAYQLTVPEIEQLLLTLPQIQAELREWKATSVSARRAA